MRFLVSALLMIYITNTSCSRQEVTRLKTDVCIVGAGSGGIGAALAASRAGAEIVLIEKQGRIGGTSTMAFVNNWEPGPGCSYAREIYDRMMAASGAVSVSKGKI